MSSKNLSLPLVLVLIVVTGGTAFFGGIQYQKSKSPVGRSRQFGARQISGMPNTFRGFNGSQVINGEITAVDANSFTLKTPDGSSQIILVSGSTAFKKMSDGNKSDLTVGQRVMVAGTKDNSGSLTAFQVSSGLELPFGRGNRRDDNTTPQN
jgi:hypothetical protein